MNTISPIRAESESAPLVHVPFMLAGELVEGDAIAHHSRDLGATFLTPALDFDRIARPRSEPSPAAALSVAEIIDFLAETGKRLTMDNPHLQWALEASAPLQNIPRSLVERVYAKIGEPFRREVLEIIVNSDVGVEALDGWKPVQPFEGRQSYVRATPPRLVYVLAGNSPQVAAVSITRGALTKGVHLLKMPSNDPFTTIAILKTMKDIDPGHPVLRSFSAVYWKGGDARVEGVLYRPQFFDKIVVWGGEAAVRHAQKYVGPGFQLISWDPKTSVSFIGREAFQSDQILSDVADRAATDVTVMNQDACVASRYIYIEADDADADRFCEKLLAELGKERLYCTALGPPTPNEIRDEVTVLRQLAPEYGVWGDFSGAGLVIRSREPVDFFPDCRTVNVVPVARLEDGVAYTNVATQTATIFPPERRVELRDRLADFGVQYVRCLGESMGGAPGLPHDGTYELNRLVRWVADSGPITDAR